MATNSSSQKKGYALVTGGTSGIGYELAKLLAQDGYNLALVARSSDRLLEASDEFQELGVDVLLLDKDLFDPKAAREIYHELKSQNITIDILINNASQGQRGKFHEVDLLRHIEIMQLNVVSLVAITKLFLDDMVKRNKGKILNLASVVSKTPAPEFSVYAASKAFILSFSQALANELEDTNITVTVLLPGRTDSDFFDNAEMTDTKEYLDHDLADPASVAKDGYTALMSGESRVVSGVQNNISVGMMNAMPDSANAEKMQRNMQPSEKTDEEKKQRPAHGPSQREQEATDKEQA